MTYGDIMANAGFDAGDTSADYQTAVLQWVNTVRNMIYVRGPWASTVRSNVSFTTSAATTSGIYTLQDESGNKYTSLASDSMFDQTNEQTIRHESLARTWEVDHARTTPGSPSWWADAGLSTDGDKQVQLWPVPNGTYVIIFIGRPRMVDITSTGVSVDPYFGQINQWAEVLTEGVRIYHDINNNESASQIVYQRRAFEAAIKLKKTTERMTVTSTDRLAPVNAQTNHQQLGRLDPSVYSNN